MSESETKALLDIETSRELTRNVTYAIRHNRLAAKNKIKSTRNERSDWIQLNVESDDLLKRYTEKFNTANETFIRERKIANNNLKGKVKMRIGYLLVAT